MYQVKNGLWSKHTYKKPNVGRVKCVAYVGFLFIIWLWFQNCMVHMCRQHHISVFICGINPIQAVPQNANIHKNQYRETKHDDLSCDYHLQFEQIASI